MAEALAGTLVIGGGFAGGDVALGAISRTLPIPGFRRPCDP